MRCTTWQDRAHRLTGSIATAALLLAVSVGAASAAEDDVSRQLNQLFLDFSIASRPLFPLAATANGWRAYDDQFANDISDAHREKQREWCLSFQAALGKFDRSALGDHDRLSYDIFAYNLQRCFARLALDLHLLPVDQAGWSMPATFPIFASGKGAHPFRNARDYDNLLLRIPGFVEWMDTAIANMRRGVERGWTQPRPIMESTLPQLESMIVDDPRKSLFYQPIQNMPQSIAQDDRARLSAAYEQMIAKQVVPAYARLRDFIRDEYLPKSRTSAGIGAMPDGPRLYQYYIEANTTTTLTADEIFELGQRELARVWARIEVLKAASGFKGDIRDWARKLSAGATRHGTQEEAIAAYRALHDKVEPQLPKFFSRLPEARYEIRAVEAYRELGASSQYWGGSGNRPGIFYVNLSALSKDPVPVSVNLFLHETIPGHHFQIALARENRSLPNFRRVAGHPAFTEGWATYAETLGLEMGLYGDPYDQLAFLNSQLWGASNLVADVGINVKGWTREQTLAFLNDNSLSPYLHSDYERSNSSTVERFMARPAYALAYRVGQLTMSDLRAQAERALGPGFDLRAFHDELLNDGAMPLQILRQKMELWIASQRR